MPVESQYPSFKVPDQDLWAFLFERKDRPFPDDKGVQLAIEEISGLLIKKQ